MSLYDLSRELQTRDSEKRLEAAERLGKRIGKALARFILYSGWGIVIANTFNLGQYLPPYQKTEAGYVAPADVRLTRADENKNNDLETVLTIKGTRYHLLYDSNNRPVLQRYEVQPEKTQYSPPEIIPETDPKYSTKLAEKLEGKVLGMEEAKAKSKLGGKQ